MQRFFISLFIAVVVLTAASGATLAYLSDGQTSDTNAFDAGTFDLTLDGGNTNVTKFTVANIKPGYQKFVKWTAKNTGTVDGYLDLHGIAITSDENGCLDPETEAGDVTCTDPGAGELANALGLDLFVDYDCDTYYDAGDRKFYGTGAASGIVSDYDLNEPLAAGATKCITAQFNWWNNRYIPDNRAQGDDLTMDMTFELGQTTAQ
ncbi:CalY family protein [Patescibacteria group bacterium]|nr:CalY family protein [Patescibacteria group bacterium]